VRIVVKGANGNVGTSLLQAVAGDSAIDSVVGVSRRQPRLDFANFAKTEWATADVAQSDLVRLFRGADAVVHLAWLIQPARDPALLERANLAASLGWALVLERLLGRRANAATGALAGLGIGVLDLGRAGRLFPRIRALPLLPQLADHVAYGATVGYVLARAQR
jgi:hypothetical protein